MSEIATEVEKTSYESVSIVAIGSFNPAIFHPLWLSSNGLIRPEEAASAEINIITKDVAVFHTEWFGVQILSESLTFDTRDSTKPRPLRDLVLGTFRILEHTPIKAFGFNSRKHFLMESEEDWHAFGHHYAPKASWNAVLQEPGMSVLGMVGKRPNCKANAINITIQPSLPQHPGVFIHVNEHYEVPKEKLDNQPDRIAFFLGTLQDAWEGFLVYCDLVDRHLLSEYKKEGK